MYQRSTSAFLEDDFFRFFYEEYTHPLSAATSAKACPCKAPHPKTAKTLIAASNIKIMKFFFFPFFPYKYSSIAAA